MKPINRIINISYLQTGPFKPPVEIRVDIRDILIPPLLILLVSVEALLPAEVPIRLFPVPAVVRTSEDAPLLAAVFPFPAVAPAPDPVNATAVPSPVVLTVVLLCVFTFVKEMGSVPALLETLIDIADDSAVALAVPVGEMLAE